jgi:cAMP-dependent protein kinase regulator
MSDAERIRLQKLIYALESEPKIYETLTDNEVLGIICIILNKSSYHRSFAEMDILKKATRHNVYFQNMINQE